VPYHFATSSALQVMKFLTNALGGLEKLANFLGMINKTITSYLVE
jgi:hypothetical protein